MSDLAAMLTARLAAVRRARRISQAKLAEELGVTQTAVSYWESGRRDVGLSDFVRWAAALGQQLSVEDGPCGERAAAGPRGCPNCERCTWNPGPDCGQPEHPHCPRCGHCEGRHK